MSQGTPPTEQELRDYFGDSLPAYTAIERIPHTTVWATDDGVLLWDWRNGYAVNLPLAIDLFFNLRRVVKVDAARSRIDKRHNYKFKTDYR